MRGGTLTRGTRTKRYRDLAGHIEPNVLTATGWGVLFGYREEKRAKEPLHELLRNREHLAGVNFHEQIIPGTKEGSCIDARDFLWKELQESPGVVDISKLPYYVLIVGSPEEVPFEFQYELAVNRAVGRLYFDEPEDYRRYAQALLATEKRRKLPLASRSMGFFFADREDDEVNGILDKYFVGPTREALEARQQAWKVPFWRNENDKADTLRGLLQGDPTVEPSEGPRVDAEDLSGLVVVCHGKECDSDRGIERQHEKQGGLVCGPREAVFASHLKPQSPTESPISGRVFFLLACYGVGTPEMEDYASPEKTMRTGKIIRPKRLTPKPFIARLPQRLLANGALGVVGHVNRGLTASFRWLYSDTQTEAARSYSDMLARFMAGERLGHAMRPMSRRGSNIANHIMPFIRHWIHSPKPKYRDLSLQWVSWVDARNFVLLGDPAADAFGTGSRAGSAFSGGTEPVHLRPEVARRLVAEANLQGSTVSDYIGGLLPSADQGQASRGQSAPRWERVPAGSTFKPLAWAFEKGTTTVDPGFRDGLGSKSGLDETGEHDADLILGRHGSGTRYRTFEPAPRRKVYRDGRPAGPAARWRLMDRDGQTFGPGIEAYDPHVWGAMKKALLDAAVSHLLHQVAAAAHGPTDAVEITWAAGSEALDAQSIVVSGTSLELQARNPTQEPVWIEAGFWLDGQWQPWRDRGAVSLEPGAQASGELAVPRGAESARPALMPQRGHLLVLVGGTAAEIGRSLAGGASSGLGRTLQALLLDHALPAPAVAQHHDWALKVQSVWLRGAG